MPIAPTNAAGIELAYETFGDPDDEPILFIMGLGAQLHAWDALMLEAFVDRGFFVIRYDNRDVGLSTKPDVGPVDILTGILTAFGGGTAEAPYMLTDMAADAVSLLDHLGIARVHLVGASMGGMIAQTVAIEHPDRVATLTSIMSTTGDRDVGQPEADIAALLLRSTPPDREGAIALNVEIARAIGSPDHFDEDRAVERATIAHDRCHFPAGVGHQLLAVLASGSRTAALGALTLPALVIHGDLDPLIPLSGGHRTAETIPGAEVLVLEGMGHDLPPVFWPQIVERVTALAAAASAPSA